MRLPTVLRVACVLALAAAPARADEDMAVDPATSPVLFADATYGSPFPDELLYNERDGMTTFRAVYDKDGGHTSVIYGRIESGRLQPTGRAPGDAKWTFIPRGVQAVPVGTGATTRNGRDYAFERYEFAHGDARVGCFVAAAPGEMDVVIVNHCQFGPHAPEDAEVGHLLGLLSFADGDADPI